jgi:hypothetical protein
MVLFTLYASISSAQDTILTNILNFENPIREIVKDGNENIYVQTLEGVFLLKGNSFEKIDFKISNFDGIVVYNKKLTTRRTLEKKNIFFVREKPQVP